MTTEIILLEEAAARAPAARGTTECLLENVFKAAAKCSAAGAKTVGAPAEAFEAGLPAEAAAGAGPEPFKALEARLAPCINLAAGASLALGRIAQNLISRVHLGKPSRCPRVVLVGVGVQLLGELAEGIFDLRSPCTLRYPKRVIGVAHGQMPPSSHLGRDIPPSGTLAALGMWGGIAVTATIARQRPG